MTDSNPPIALETRTQDQARLSSPSISRNRGPVSDALAIRLPDGAHVLEIACGTGEHALALVTRRPDLTWTPSDRDADARASADAWATDSAGRMTPALNLDVMTPDWTGGLDRFEAVYCSNMIHIAPIEACQGLFSGAGQLLSEGGLLLIYGPFLEGEETAPSNLEFDQSLKRRDPRWGVRALSEVDDIAAQNGFTRTERLEMPSNNRLLTYRKGAA